MTRFALAASLTLFAGLLTLSAFPASGTTEKVLYSFKNFKYGEPWGRLLFHGPALFGTGTGENGGTGQVFRLVQSKGIWKKSSPLQFDGSDGSKPFAGLIADSLGTFYGTTASGDVYDYGNVFALWKSGSAWLHGTVWAFGNGSDGQQPTGDLVIDSSGNIYGTTQLGGTSGDGIVFELSSNGSYWTESVLHNFTGSDGAIPWAGLLRDKSGNLYGTTSQGAAGDCGGAGCGTVFELIPGGGGWTFNTLYSFAGGLGDAGTSWAGLVQGSHGTLYGTTTGNGAHFWGTVFELTKSGSVWSEKVLYSFTGGSDGGTPQAALHFNGSGGLYGTAVYGGNPGCYNNLGCGVVFELTQSGGIWTESVLYSFSSSGGDGQNPADAVIFDKAGNLYGTTFYGGAYDNGTVWEITP